MILDPSYVNSWETKEALSSLNLGVQPQYLYFFSFASVTNSGLHLKSQSAGRFGVAKTSFCTSTEDFQVNIQTEKKNPARSSLDGAVDSSCEIDSDAAGHRSTNME